VISSSRRRPAGDVDEIWDYYASEVQNVDAADRIRDELLRHSTN
jgi:hypothetical protein